MIVYGNRDGLFKAYENASKMLRNPFCSQKMNMQSTQKRKRAKWMEQLGFLEPTKKNSELKRTF